MRITAESLVLVGIILGLFLLALLCLAFSLSGRELLDCSILRCCWDRRRDRNSNARDVEDPPVYATLNEFVFEAESSSDDKHRGGGASGYLGSNAFPTTMQQVFPDLLGGDGGQGSGGTINGNNSHDGSNFASSANGDLREPLL
jgi:hypothetical protein